MNFIPGCLSELQIGSPQSIHNLTMTPLLSEKNVETDYLLLDKALENDLIEISEISESGSVPDLKVLNKSAQRILLLDGEELLGAKQNRILNVSVMVPAEKTIKIPVSCVESGRWAHQSRTFRSAGRAHYAQGRAKKARSVNYSLRMRGTRRGDQSEVWAENSRKAERLRAQSDTAASDAMFTKFRGSLDEYLNGVSVVSNQTGAIFSLNGSATGVDLFESAEVLSGCLNKLVESYALDAIDYRRSGTDGKNHVAVDKLLEQIGKAKPESYPAVGEGDDLRFDNAEVSGGALVVEERVIHLCAFHIDDEEQVSTRRSRMVRASARNRYRRN